MPATYNVGGRPTLTFTPTLAGVPADATVALAVVAPSGDTSAPGVVHTGVGLYEAEVDLDQPGTWVWTWTATGAVTAVEDGWLIVEAPVDADIYASVAELRLRFGIDDTFDDELLEKAVRTASRSIDDCCGRRFYTDQATTPRVYVADSRWQIDVDDFWTVDGLEVAIDYGDTGVYGTVWDDAAFTVRPYNGVVDGRSGWPFHQIRTRRLAWFPCSHSPSVQVTAKWGWQAVPHPIREACLLLAAELFKLKDAPFGVAGWGDFGPIRVRDNPKVCALIKPYERHPVLMA